MQAGTSQYPSLAQRGDQWGRLGSLCSASAQPRQDTLNVARQGGTRCPRGLGGADAQDPTRVFPTQHTALSEDEDFQTNLISARVGGGKRKSYSCRRNGAATARWMLHCSPVHLCQRGLARVKGPSRVAAMGVTGDSSSAKSKVSCVCECWLMIC